MLTKDEPGEDHRQDALETQQERGVRRCCLAQAEHQEDGAHAAAARDRGHKPRNVGAPERRFPLATHDAAEEPHGTQAHARTQVEQARCQPGIGAEEYEFRRRRAETEQQCGDERENDGLSVRSHRIVPPPTVPLISCPTAVFRRGPVAIGDPGVLEVFAR